MSLISGVIAALADETAAAIVAASLLAVLAALVVISWITAARYDGPYEVLSEEHSWDLQDPDGSTAVATKRLDVRFNYRTLVIADSAWGDSPRLFTNYRCAPGEHVHTRREGPREIAVFSCRSYARRGTPKP